jgi:hypothetical protein
VPRPFETPLRQAQQLLRTNGQLNKADKPLIDNFSIALTHGLIALALWRLLMRDDLDSEVSERDRWQRQREDAADA